MEKLQAALSRAREKREHETGVPSPTSGGARVTSRRTGGAEVVQARWDELTEYEPAEGRLNKALIYTDKPTLDAQHFDILRTKLFLEMRRNGWTRIAITSATSGCGKTTTACNLITGLCRQPDNRGILFDMDFRRPAVSKLFGASPAASLEDVFRGEKTFAEQALRLRKNVAISMTPKPVSDPANVILRSQTAETLDRIQAEYRPELMLFDMPPVLVSDETRGFLKLVDAVLIVAGAGKSTVSQVDEVEREVAQYTNVAGIVLNKCKYMDEGYSYSY